MEIIEAARLHLSPQYLDATHVYLRQRIYLVKRLNVALLEAMLQKYGSQVQSDPAGIAQQLEQWLERATDRTEIWEAVTQMVWVAMLVWTVQDLEPSIAKSVIQTLGIDAFQPEVWQSLFEPKALLEVSQRQTLLSELELRICQILTTQILETPEVLEPLLVGVSLEPNAGCELRLAFEPWAIWDAICALAESAPNEQEQPSIEAAQAELKIDALKADNTAISDILLPASSARAPLWQSENPADAVSPILLEHYLTRPSELYRLPWELLAQVRQQSGLPMVQLLFLLSGHAMRSPHPAQKTFTLTQFEILEQLDWRVQVSLPEPPNLTMLMEQLSQLKIASIWMMEASKTQGETVHTSGLLWDLVTEMQGGFDWTMGEVLTPQDVIFTIRPGLWFHRLRQQGGPQARDAGLAFGQVALKLLQQDFCRDSFLISLLITLSLDAPEPLPGVRTPSYTVRSLLDTVLPVATTQVLQIHVDIALALLKQWNQALLALRQLGWTGDRTIVSTEDTGTGNDTAVHDFYLDAYPDWLSVPRRKPLDWVQQWLALRVNFQAPQNWMAVTARAPLSPSLLSQGDYGLRRLRFDRLTGTQVRTARKVKHLTQSQLADILHVHQSLIAKIEAGHRTVTEDLERGLREVLEL